MLADTVAEQHLWPLIKAIKFAMFTTHNSDGHLHSRPMTTQNKTMLDDKLWFFMSVKGDTAQDLTQQPQVNISYADTGNDVYISVSGSESESFSGATEQRARKASGLGAKRSHSGLWRAFATTTGRLWAA